MMIPEVHACTNCKFQSQRPIPTVIEENTILKRWVHACDSICNCILRTRNSQDAIIIILGRYINSMKKTTISSCHGLIRPMAISLIITGMCWSLQRWKKSDDF